MFEFVRSAWGSMFASSMVAAKSFGLKMTVAVSVLTVNGTSFGLFGHNGVDPNGDLLFNQGLLP